jgi:hypothetical protein
MKTQCAGTCALFCTLFSCGAPSTYPITRYSYIKHPVFSFPREFFSPELNLSTPLPALGISTPIPLARNEFYFKPGRIVDLAPQLTSPVLGWVPALLCLITQLVPTTSKTYILVCFRPHLYDSPPHRTIFHDQTNHPASIQIP